jgi:cobalamin synthase
MALDGRRRRRVRHGGPASEVAGASLASDIRQAARGMPLAVSAAVAATSVLVLAGRWGVVGLLGACLAAEGNAALARRRLAGVTGDVIGAGGLLAETIALGVVTLPA